MKPTSTWPRFVLIDLYLLPFVSSQVKHPEIIQISNPLPSKDDKIGIHNRRRMVSSLPRSCLICNWTYLSPQFSIPVKNTNSIEPFLVISPSSYYNYSIVFLIVVSSTIRSEGRNIPSCFVLFPSHSLCVETPQIIHVE